MLFVPGYALVPTGIVPSFAKIILILGGGALSDVVSSIVQRIVIFVVASCFTTKNKSLHRNDFAVRHSSLRIKTFRVRIPYSMPIESIEPFVVPRIDDSVLSLCKTDETVGLVERLNYCVSLHAFLHRCTSNALRFSRYCTIAICDFYAHTYS